MERFEAERQWHEYFAGQTGNHLDPSIPKTDIADLTAAAAKVKDYVDDHVAHTSAASTGPKVTLQLADVHEAMKPVDRLFRRYHGLLTCSTFITTTPVGQDDFYAVFRVSWARPDYHAD